MAASIGSFATYAWRAPADIAASITALLSVLVIPAGTEITNSGLKNLKFFIHAAQAEEAGFRLRNPNAFPETDLEIQKKIYRLQLDPRKWVPWRAYGAILLWNTQLEDKT